MKLAAVIQEKMNNNKTMIKQIRLIKQYAFSKYHSYK